jgi:hypothetical protein
LLVKQADCKIFSCIFRQSISFNIEEAAVARVYGMFYLFVQAETTKTDFAMHVEPVFTNVDKI